ncbi:MAG: long-chain fatty acid--CoA ligase [Alphaproteobacteria bacterium]|nr:long-chain fatty acid--CoA ligase [Alphaproteobacteria bacterium]
MTTGAEAARAGDTFPKLLLRNATKFAGKPAMREKDLGIWQTWNWEDVLDEVRAFSVGLSELGIGPGDKVAIVGDNRPRLYWTMAATQALGGIPIPVYQDSVADEMIFALKHAGVKCAVVENQEQVDKLLEIQEKYKAITDIIYCDPRGMANYDVKGVQAFNEVQDTGRAVMKANGDRESQWLEQIAKGGPEDTAIILYTSGTTGAPKGVVLTMGSVVWAAKVANEFDKLDVNESVIAYLPMAWVGDHVFSYAQSYECGYCVNCPESPETVVEDRREIGTTYAFAPPRVYENVITLTMVQMEDASSIKKKMFDYFLGVARKVGEKILNGEPVAFTDRIKYALGEFLVYGPLKNRYGLSDVRVAYTAGEAIGPEIFRFYRSLGINLKQLYGQTEAAVYVTNQPDGEIYADTVGKTLESIEIKVDDNGEVLYRSPGVFKEYYKNPKATKETKTKDGWVHSGDAGFIDERGHLKIIDRAKDVGKLKDGTLFPPKYIENKLKFYPNIQEVVAFGHGRDYVSCFINIDLTAVGSWAERNNVSYASYQELAGHPDVYAMIEKHVEEVNRELAGEERVAGAQIKRFLILHKELDADDGEITRTAKVRRSFVAERYAPLVKALYDKKKTNQHIKTEMTFEDGRKGMIEGDVQIRDMQPAPPQAMKEAAE